MIAKELSDKTGSQRGGGIVEVGSPYNSHFRIINLVKTALLCLVTLPARKARPGHTKEQFPADNPERDTLARSHVVTN